jgi:PHD/YefM family antitoxin component YafN of YafNO toxin-antitoxin module
LIISQNFHAITCITGRNKKVSNLISVSEYVKLFNGMRALHRSIEKDIIPISKLIEEFNTVHESG